MKNLVLGTIGGIIGGAIGAAIWAAIGLATGYEVGYIAIGIGILSGFGVALGSQREGGPVAGGLAVIIAVVAVLIGKAAWVVFAVAPFFDQTEVAISSIADVVIAEHEESGQHVPYMMSEDATTIEDTYPPDIWSEAKQRFNAMPEDQQQRLIEAPVVANPFFAQVNLADDLVEEYESENKPVEWPRGMSFEEAWRPSHYPEDLWADVEQRWGAMSREERYDYEQSVEAFHRHMYAQSAEMFQAEVEQAGFADMFSLHDVLWIGLAVVTAWGIGSSGGAGSEC